LRNSSRVNQFSGSFEQSGQKLKGLFLKLDLESIPAADPLFEVPAIR